MAKQTSGYLGGFSGRLGPAVGYMWNGKWCVRSHQAMVRNPRTEAQVAHRAMFKQEVQLAARMRWAVTTTMTQLARENGMTSYNLFVSVNQPAFSLEEGVMQVDYSRLLLSLGDVPTVGTATAAWTAGNVLEVRFERGMGRGFDHVQAYVYVPELGEGYLSAPVYRRDRRIAMALPDRFAGLEAHIYLMAQDAGGRWSESVYVEMPEEQEETPQEPASQATPPATNSQLPAANGDGQQASDSGGGG